MKKIFIIFFAIVIFISAIGCSNIDNDDTSGYPEEGTKAEIDSIDAESAIKNDGDSPFTDMPNDEVGPDYHMFEFSSPQELLISLSNSGKGIDVRVDGYENSTMYSDMLERFERGEITLKYPVLAGYDKDFFTKDVVLFSSEAFGMPWIWYRRWYDEKIMVIQVSYLPDELLEYSQKHSVWDVVMQVQPTAPSIEEMKQREEIKNIEEQTLITDQGAVKILIQELSTSDRVYLTFIMDDMMIRIFGSSEDVDISLVNKLSFVDVK